ncbi:MafI family immunity protein [Microvirga terricola]|uniref:MafI family immunity protein n=1 Tax=Microvirga terricola TaxID=2719797 RepID=A0ABX0VHM4_9HYPH|nr:MafI family immunity protein [Microvirga terricola]NIX78166.1 MafI family immunity protein [Microvirga terricola]
MIGNLENRIRHLAARFRSRLSSDRLDQVIDYIDHNECGLALEMLCDFLEDEEVTIVVEEYDEIIHLAGAMRLDQSSGRYADLHRRQG